MKYFFLYAGNRIRHADLYLKRKAKLVYLPIRMGVLGIIGTLFLIITILLCSANYVTGGKAFNKLLLSLFKS